MNCEFCHKILSSKSALKTHQTKAKYCLKAQGKNMLTKSFICEYCDKSFLNKNRYYYHTSKVCTKDTFLEKQKNIIYELNKKVEEQKKTICELTERLKDKDKDKDHAIEMLNMQLKMKTEQNKNEEQRHDKLVSILAKKPTSITNTRNTQINNYIKNMPSLCDSDIAKNVQNLTLEHHVKGVEGYAEYALQFPFKNKIVCVDASRNKVKYKNENGEIVCDIGFHKMMKKLSTAIKNHSFELSQEHTKNLKTKFTENEFNEFDFFDISTALAKCSNGIHNEKCFKIASEICKNSIVNENLLTENEDDIA